jgi:uncharacterized integral membrane protein
MNIIRLILLILPIAALALLLLQNWTPMLPLVFLGTQTQPLPLGMWILLSTTAGALTSLLITSLFQLANYFSGSKPATRRPSAYSQRASSTPAEESRYQTPASPPPEHNTTDTTTDFVDDWDLDNKNVDWDIEAQQAPTPNPQSTEVRDSNTYSQNQQPKSSSQSGSVYSYSYRESKKSGNRKTESIYDADYRVIVPPYQPPQTEQADEDDWGFFDEDDSGDEEQPQDRPR